MYICICKTIIEIPYKTKVVAHRSHYPVDVNINAPHCGMDGGVSVSH